jgi:ABC-type Fe3+-hydroxamate transport system substrate-binding protein
LRRGAAPDLPPIPPTCYTAAVPILRLRDDLGRELTFARPPLRLVSLVPSDTHTVVALGAAERLVGRTRYCDLAEVAHLPVVGGTKDVDVEAVLALAPELVIGNQEENSRPALEQLAQRGAKVFVSMPRRAADAITHLARLARLLDVHKEPAVVELIRRGYRALPLSSVRPVSPTTDEKDQPLAEPAATRSAALAAEAPAFDPEAISAFVPIWLDPLMTLNADTFGSDVLAQCGVRNAFADRLRLYPLAADLGKAAPADAGDRDTRYPRVTFDEVRRRAPQLVLLPDEPFQFSAAHEAAIAAELPGVPIVRVTGRDLFWYGAWTIDAVPRLRQQLAAHTKR